MKKTGFFCKIINCTEADAQVQANVDKEVTERKEADTALEAKLKELAIRRLVTMAKNKKVIKEQKKLL